MTGCSYVAVNKKRTDCPKRKKMKKKFFFDGNNFSHPRWWSLSWMCVISLNRALNSYVCPFGGLPRWKNGAFIAPKSKFGAKCVVKLPPNKASISWGLPILISACRWNLIVDLYLLRKVTELRLQCAGNRTGNYLTGSCAPAQPRPQNGVFLQGQRPASRIWKLAQSWADLF